MHFVRTVNRAAGRRMQGDRIAPFEHAKRRKRVEPRDRLGVQRPSTMHQRSAPPTERRGERGELGSATRDRQSTCIPQPSEDRHQRAAVLSEHRPRVVTLESCDELGEGRATAPKMRPRRPSQVVVKRLKTAPNRDDDTPRSVKGAHEAFESKAESADSVLERLDEAALEREDLTQQAIALRYDDLGRVRGCSRSYVGDQIRDRQVDLVTDATDDGDTARDDRTGDPLVVEGPEVFGASAPSREDHHVEPLEALNPFDRFDDRHRGVVTLNAAVRHHQPNRAPFGGDPHDVSKGGARSTGHDADDLGEAWKRPLALRVEEPLSLEGFTDALEARGEVAFSGRPCRPRDELELAARLVERELAAKDDPRAVLQRRLGATGIGLEHHSTELGVFLLVVQREVDVTAHASNVGKLPLDQNARPAVLEGEPNRAIDLGDSKDAFSVACAFFEPLEQRHLRHERNLPPSPRCTTPKTRESPLCPSVMSNTAIVGVGSNLGSRQASIEAARRMLDAHPAIVVSAVSPLYETEPVGPPQPDYLNAALRIETKLAPAALLEVLLETERRLGRHRGPAARWAARTLDLDLLWDERGELDTESLSLPHPELERRRFALCPLLDVAPELRAHYGGAIDRLGGVLEPWERFAWRQVERRPGVLDITVEADALVDACALAVGCGPAGVAPVSTHCRTVDSSASAFAEALVEILASGFAVTCATIGHCSHSQWEARFHGANAGPGAASEAILSTIAGSMRHVRVDLSFRFTST